MTRSSARPLEMLWKETLKSNKTSPSPINATILKRRAKVQLCGTSHFSLRTSFSKGQNRQVAAVGGSLYLIKYFFRYFDMLSACVNVACKIHDFQVWQTTCKICFSRFFRQLLIQSLLRLPPPPSEKMKLRACKKYKKQKTR